MKYIFVLTILFSCVKDKFQEVELRVMTYNVLVGGGYSDKWYASMKEEYRRNRIPDIIEVFRWASPDVLCVQEAAEWGEEGIMELVANELGMTHYIYDPATWLATFSRYPILSHSSPEPIQIEFWNVSWTEWGPYTPRLLKTLHNVKGKPVEILNVHFAARQDDIRRNINKQEIQIALGIECDVVIGDFNNRREDWFERGWESSAYVPKGWGVDDILTKFEYRAIDLTDMGEKMWQSSDHIPLSSHLKFSTYE